MTTALLLALLCAAASICLGLWICQARAPRYEDHPSRKPVKGDLWLWEKSMTKEGQQ